MVDPEFWKEWEGLFKYMNRPSNLYFAEKLTEHAGGAKIWMKREDLFVHHPNSLTLVSRATLATTQARIRLTIPLGRFYLPEGSGKRASLLRLAPDNMALLQPPSVRDLVWNAWSTWVRKMYAVRP
jgi:hypothetical protein